MKTFISPPPQGLSQLWRKETVKTANKADKVIIPGNTLSLMPFMKEHKNKIHNQSTLYLTSTYVETHDNAEQLVGPNEIVALSNPKIWTNNPILMKLKEKLFDQTQHPMLTATTSNGRLVTHGGLTYGEWVELGRPATPEETAGLLNKKYYGKLFTKSCYSLGGAPNYAADPIFAHPFLEFYPSWLTTTELMPFGQIVGTRSLNSEDGREAMGNEYSPLKFIERVSFRKFGSIAFINGQEVTSVGLRPQGKQISKLPEDESFYIERS